MDTIFHLRSKQKYKQKVLNETDRRLYDKSYDENGEIAKSGSTNQSLIRSVFKTSFFNLPPPKSTGESG